MGRAGPLAEFAPARTSALARRPAARRPTASRGRTFAARVGGALDELIAAGGTWLVVCHGGVIRAALSHVTGADALRVAGPPNASVTVFELGSRPRLLVYGTLPDGGLPTGLY